MPWRVRYFKHLSFCISQCKKVSCTKLLRWDKYEYHHETGKPRVILSNSGIYVNTNPRYELTFLLQQTIGLSAMFFDIVIRHVIYGLVNGILISPISRVAKGLCKCFRRRRFKKILTCLGCSVHLWYSIRSFFNYKISSETFHGQSLKPFALRVKVCLYDAVREWDKYGISYSVNFAFGDELGLSSIARNQTLDSLCFIATPPEMVQLIRDTYLLSITVRRNHRYDISFSFFNFTRPFIYFMAPDGFEYRLHSYVFKQNPLPVPYPSKCVDNVIDIRAKDRLRNELYMAILPTRGGIISNDLIFRIFPHDFVISTKEIPAQTIIDFTTYTASLLGL